MNAPEIPKHGLRRWRKFANEAMEFIKTIRPIAGTGISVSEIKGGGTLISSRANEGGALIVTLCQNRELRRFAMNGRDLGPVEEEA